MSSALPRPDGKVVPEQRKRMHRRLSRKPPVRPRAKRWPGKAAAEPTTKNTTISIPGCFRYCVPLAALQVFPKATVVLRWFV